jgi:hypothetical protein
MEELSCLRGDTHRQTIRERDKEEVHRLLKRKQNVMSVGIGGIGGTTKLLQEKLTWARTPTFVELANPEENCPNLSRTSEDFFSFHPPLLNGPTCHINPSLTLLQENFSVYQLRINVDPVRHCAPCLCRDDRG